MKIKTKRGARRIRNQRVITRRFVTTDYTGCPYITAGKRYALTALFLTSGKIVDDDDDNINIVLPLRNLSCSHIDNNDWQWGVI